MELIWYRICSNVGWDAIAGGIRGKGTSRVFSNKRASPPTLSMWPCKTKYSYTSNNKYLLGYLLTNLFPTPPMKLKLRLQIGGRLLIANHLDESNYLPNRNSEKLIKYDLISLGCSLKLVLYSAPFTMRPSGPRPTVSVRFYTGACFLHQRSRAGVTKRNRRARTRDPPTHAPTQPTNQPTNHRNGACRASEAPRQEQCKLQTVRHLLLLFSPLLPIPPLMKDAASVPSCGQADGSGRGPAICLLSHQLLLLLLFLLRFFGLFSLLISSPICFCIPKLLVSSLWISCDLEQTLFLGFEGAGWTTDNWSVGLVIQPAHDSLFSSPLFHHTSSGCMEANCCSSGCFRFGRRRNARTDPDNKPATGTGTTVFKRFSRERSLGFTLEDVNNKASHKAGRQAAKSPLTQYCPPCDDRPTATTVVVGLADSKQHPIKELRGGPAKVSDFCTHHQPLRKMIVKETHHVVRSEVSMFFLLCNSPPFAPWVLAVMS